MSNQILSKSEALGQITRNFLFMWILTGLGMLLGSFLPPVVALGMSILAIVVLIITFFVKSRTTVNKLFYAVPFLMGFAFYFSITYYLGELGTGLVLGILALTILLFFAMGVIGGVMIKRDLGFLGQILLFALIGLIIISIVGIFVSSYALHIFLAGAGILIFCLFTLYDFNQIAKQDITSEDTVGHALNLYLDFINLFLNLLKLANLLSGDD